MITEQTMNIGMAKFNQIGKVGSRKSAALASTVVLIFLSTFVSMLQKNQCGVLPEAHRISSVQHMSHKRHLLQGFHFIHDQIQT